MVTVARSLTNQLRAFQHPTGMGCSLQALPLNTRSPFHSPDLRLIRITNLCLGISGHILRFTDLAAREDCLGPDLVGLGASLVGDLLRFPGVLLGSFGVLGGVFELLVHVRFVLFCGYVEGIADGEAAQFSIMVSIPRQEWMYLERCSSWLYVLLTPGTRPVSQKTDGPR